MKKLICAACAASLLMSSCIGSFGLTNKLLAWNKTIDNKFVNELVFFAFWIVPVYEVSALADLTVLNSIEFWSGTSPVAKGKSIIDGDDSRYLVDCDGKGYTITRLADGTVTRLNFDPDERMWSLEGYDGEEYPLICFVGDSHAKVPAADGSWMQVELTRDGILAYETEMMTQSESRNIDITI